MSELVITVDEVLSVLRAVEIGSEAIATAVDPMQEYCGNIHYITSTGWHLVVFLDCGDFDYFDSITAPDGRRIDFDDFKDTPEIVNYRPPEHVERSAYRISRAAEIENGDAQLPK